jgi:Zn-finger nucleic acid-binding protein
MEPVRFEHIEVDRCVRCGGLWFDHLEKEELKERPGSEAIDSGPTWRAAIHNEQGKVYCPRDGMLMLVMVDPGQPEFRVESCPVCHGTFFDAGEFTDWKQQKIGELLDHLRRS